MQSIKIANLQPGMIVADQLAGKSGIYRRQRDLVDGHVLVSILTRGGNRAQIFAESKDTELSLLYDPASEPEEHGQYMKDSVEIRTEALLDLQEDLEFLNELVKP